MKRIILTLFFLLPQVAFCEQENVRIDLKIWSTEIKGFVKSLEEGLSATRLNLHDDLWIERYEEIPEVRIKSRLSRKSYLGLGFWTGKYDGQIITQSDVNYAGSIYYTGTLIESKLIIQSFKVVYKYELLYPLDEYIEFSLGVEFGARLNRISSRLEATNVLVPYYEKELANLLVPTLGIYFRSKFTEWTSFEIGVDGIYFKGIADKNISFLDASSELKLNIYRGFSILAGYKLVRLDVSFERSLLSRFDFSGTMYGPFIGIKYSF